MRDRNHRIQPISGSPASQAIRARRKSWDWVGDGSRFEKHFKHAKTLHKDPWQFRECWSRVTIATGVHKTPTTPYTFRRFCLFSPVRVSSLKSYHLSRPAGRHVHRRARYRGRREMAKGVSRGPLSAAKCWRFRVFKAHGIWLWPSWAPAGLEPRQDPGGIYRPAQWDETLGYPSS